MAESRPRLFKMNRYQVRIMLLVLVPPIIIIAAFAFMSSVFFEQLLLAVQSGSEATLVDFLIDWKLYFFILLWILFPFDADKEDDFYFVTNAKAVRVNLAAGQTFEGLKESDLWVADTLEQFDRVRHREEPYAQMLTAYRDRMLPAAREALEAKLAILS